MGWGDAASMNLWLLLAVNSITLGGLLFLLSAGFSLIFGLMRVPNLTHGSFFMLGAYFGVSFLQSGLGFWPTVLLSGLLVAALGVEHAGDGAQHGGLPRAVGAEHGDDLAGGHVQADAADGLDGTVEGLDGIDGEERHGDRATSSLPPCGGGMGRGGRA